MMNYLMLLGTASHFEKSNGWTLCGRNNVKITKNKKEVTCLTCLKILKKEERKLFMKWKSTAKLLPTRSQYCLCIHNDEKPFIAYYNANEEDFLTNHVQKFPTHWMEIPKLPKEK